MWMVGSGAYWWSILGHGTIGGSQMVKVFEGKAKKYSLYPIE